MKAAVGIIVALVAGAAIGYGVALKAPRMGGQPTGGNVAPGGPLFELDGKTYAEADLPVDVQMSIHEAHKEASHRVDGLLNQFAMRLDLAKKAGRDKEVPLPNFEELLAVEKPSEAELRQLFDANKDRLPPGTSFEQIRPDIEKYVTSQKMSEAMQGKAAEFKSTAKFKSLVVHPPAPRVDIDTSKMTAFGNKDSKDVVIEVADYLCPHCQMMHGEVEKLYEEMKGRIKFHPVAFSLRPSGLSGTLARGALCAQKLGEDKYWSWHKSAFEMAKSKGWKLSDPDAMEPVQEIAAAAQLDAAALETCINSEEAKSELASLIDRMEAVGVSSTPTFFVNGRRLDVHGNLRDEIMRSLGASSH